MTFCHKLKNELSSAIFRVGLLNKGTQARVGKWSLYPLGELLGPKGPHPKFQLNSSKNFEHRLVMNRDMETGPLTDYEPLSQKDLNH